MKGLFEAVKTLFGFAVIVFFASTLVDRAFAFAVASDWGRFLLVVIGSLIGLRFVVPFVRAAWSSERERDVVLFRSVVLNRALVLLGIALVVFIAYRASYPDVFLRRIACAHPCPAPFPGGPVASLIEFRGDPSELRPGNRATVAVRLYLKESGVPKITRIEWRSAEGLPATTVYSAGSVSGGKRAALFTASAVTALAEIPIDAQYKRDQAVIEVAYQIATPGSGNPYLVYDREERIRL